MLEVPGHEIAWLKVVSYARIESCQLDLKRLNGEVNGEELPGDENVSDTDSLDLLLQRDAGWTQDNSIDDPPVVSS